MKANTKCSVPDCTRSALRTAAISINNRPRELLPVCKCHWEAAQEDKPDALAKGFTCECGQFHRYGSYVYAHWRERLVHTCEQCGAKHNILLGVPHLTKKGSKQKGK